MSYRDEPLLDVYRTESHGLADAGYRDRAPRLELQERRDLMRGAPDRLAERDYGVVIDEETMAIDVDATTRAREERAGASAE